MARVEAPEAFTVTVAYSPAPRVVEQVVVAMRPGSTVQQAVEACGLLQRHPAAAGLPAGIWGRKAEPSSAVRAGDRVEILRPLQCDPKEARRIRYRQKAEKGGRAGRASPGSAGEASTVSGTRSK